MVNSIVDTYYMRNEFTGVHEFMSDLCVEEKLVIALFITKYPRYYSEHFAYSFNRQLATEEGWRIVTCDNYL